MSKKILAVNGGSSSIKFKVYDYQTLTEEAAGICERIGIDGALTIKYENGKVFNSTKAMPNHDVAIQIALNALIDLKIISNFEDIVGVGHRIVQGGVNFQSSAVLTAKEVDEIDTYSRLAPLHNHTEAQVVRGFLKSIPKTKNVGVFDTSFHSTLPQKFYDYTLDRELTEKYEIRRYGFHGTSYRYITQQMQKILKKQSVNLIICHIGNGASICAVKDNKSYNTSMGFTPLEGLVMGTRCGDIDASIPIFLSRQGLSADEIETRLNKKAGLIGLSGFSDGRDVNKLILKKDPIGILTREIQVQKISDYVVKYINQLNNQVDAIVFTAGIGENDPNIIWQTAEHIAITKLVIDRLKLSQSYDDYILVSTRESSIPVYKVRTNEELMIAQDTKNLINV